MSIHTLSNVTLRTIQNYRHAATRVVGAYRAGSRRLIRVVNRSLDQRIEPRAKRLGPQLASALERTRSNVTAVMSRGVDSVANGSGKLIEFGAAAAVAPVKRATRFADSIANRTLAETVDVASRLMLPGAKFALALSTKVAGGADTLSNAVSGGSASEAASAAAGRAKRSVAVASNQVSTAARKAKRRVTKAAKAPVRGARKAR
jgi:hypothetical protein